MSKIFTDEQIKELLGDYNNGMLKNDMKDKYHVSERTLYNLLNKRNVKKRRVSFTKDSKEKAWEMALNGASYVEISEETGISMNLAYTYVKRVEKEIERINDENLVRAIPLEKTRYIVINGTSYTDITDFVAGI